jgi:hypothetical protein
MVSIIVSLILLFFIWEIRMNIFIIVKNQEVLFKLINKIKEEKINE